MLHHPKITIRTTVLIPLLLVALLHIPRTTTLSQEVPAKPETPVTPAASSATIPLAAALTESAAAANSYLELGLALKDRPLQKFKAIRAFREALRRDPASLMGLYELAATYLELDGWEAQREARSALIRLLTTDPFYRDAYARWQSLYLSQQENRDVARAFRERLQSAFDPALAARCADLYIQNSAWDELGKLLQEWKARTTVLESRYHYYLARWLFAVGRGAEATGSFLEGLRLASREEDLEPYRADLAALLPQGEEFSRNFMNAADEAANIRAFWELRDPLPFSALNERLAEQYRRIAEARKRYLWKKPLAKEKTLGDYIDDLGRPSFETRLEGRSLDDRGTIYLRHGEPDLRQMRIGPGGAAGDGLTFGAGEYWRYERPEMPDGRLQFHFKLMEGPLARGNDMVYSILPTTDIGEANVRLGHAGSEGVENTILGLETDTYAFDYGASFLPLTVSTVTFRNQDDPRRTDVVMVAALLSAAGERGERDVWRTQREEIHVVQQLKLQASPGIEEIRLRDSVKVADSKPDGAGGAFQISSLPGERPYALQLDLNPTGVYGVTRGNVQIPSYAERAPQLSDLLLAEARDRAAPSSAVVGEIERQGHPLRPLASPVLNRVGGLELYYEVYDLPMGEDGKARYRVEYRVSASERAKPSLLGRIFGGGQRTRESGEQVTLAFEREQRGAAERIGETMSLDLSALPPGRYHIEVKVLDRVSGREMGRTATLELREPIGGT
jgi:hypothetical protein